MTSRGRSFDAIADLYDDVRPDYPAELYDAVSTAVGTLVGRDVVELGAGTGIATRALTDRRARVVAVDPGEAMVRRLRAVTPDAAAVVASAERLPFSADRFDLAVCATAWHWLDVEPTIAELRRVLRHDGHIALWWANNRWGEGVPWEDARSAVYDQWETKHGSRAWNFRGVAPLDAAADLRARGLRVVVEREFVWMRERTNDQHVTSLATHSDVIALGDRKDEFLAEVRAALEPWPVVTERLWGPLVVASL